MVTETVVPEDLDSVSISSPSRISLLFYSTILQSLYGFIHLFLYVSAIWHRLRLQGLMLIYHHSRSPQFIRNDVQKLLKVPKHVAVVVRAKDTGQPGGGIDGLLEDVAELSAWCIGAGIPQLTVYERSGILKSIPLVELNKYVSKRLEFYFGTGESPAIKLSVPHIFEMYKDAKGDKVDLAINFLSSEDGRQTVVELTRTLAQLAVENQVSVEDLRVPVIDGEMKCLVGEEPDLLILFGSSIDLDGFPPWQLRLCEIFYEPDNDRVSYSVFLSGLKSYSNCKINVGR